MDQLIATILVGISSGATYSLMALAIVLVWRSTRIVNFAQAGQAIFSTYIAYEVLTRSGSFLMAIILAVALGALLGAGLDYFLIRTLSRHVSDGAVAALAPVIATLGVLGIIRGVVGLIWGNDFRQIESPVSQVGFVFNGESYPFSPYSLLVIAISALLILALSILFQRTSLGLSLRASAFNPEIARLAGVRVGMMRTIGWALAGATGAVAGILVTPTSYLSPNSLDLLLVSGFVAAVIGGLDSMPGAVVGGLILGIGLAFVISYLSPTLALPASFIVLILVLIAKPTGIFGARGMRSA